jgi:hypothetical protein
MRINTKISKTAQLAQRNKLRRPNLTYECILLERRLLNFYTVLTGNNNLDEALLCCYYFFRKMTRAYYVLVRYVVPLG